MTTDFCFTPQRYEKKQKNNYSLKHINPMQELFNTLFTKLLQTLCSLYNGAFQFQMGLGIEFVSIANHLFLKNLRLIDAIRRQRQVLTLYLFTA